MRSPGNIALFARAGAAKSIDTTSSIKTRAIRSDFRAQVCKLSSAVVRLAFMSTFTTIPLSTNIKRKRSKSMPIAAGSRCSLLEATVRKHARRGLCLRLSLQLTKSPPG
jgi:hypothetical protein